MPLLAESLDIKRMLVVSGQDLQIGRFAGGETSIQSSARVTRGARSAMLAYSVASGLTRSACVERSTRRLEKRNVRRSRVSWTLLQQGNSRTLTLIVVFFGCSFFVFQY